MADDGRIVPVCNKNLHYKDNNFKLKRRNLRLNLKLFNKLFDKFLGIYDIYNAVHFCQSSYVSRNIDIDIDIYR